MTRRVAIGKRANGDIGIFVSPAGIDAYTAPDSQLLLSITERLPQLLLLGFVNSTQSVSLGVTGRPLVFVTGSGFLSGIPGYSQSGPSRPSPLGYGTSSAATVASATIQAGGAYMDVQASLRTVYAVYNRPF